MASSRTYCDVLPAKPNSRRCIPARFDEGRKLYVLPVGIDHDVGVGEHIWERGVGLK